MPHHASWHLMRTRPAAARRRSMASIGCEAARLEGDFEQISSAMRASLPCAPITAIEIINAMWGNATTGFREPPEPEPAIQSTPPKPLTPAGGAARPIALTWLSGGAACLEIKDVELSLNSDEVALLRTICSPSPSRGPGVTVLEALELARMALVTNHNVLATDRPDLPRSPDTGWTTNFLREIAAIDAAVEMQVGSRSRTDLGCGRCSTNQRSGPGTGHSTPVPELPGSRTPDEVRS